LLVSLPVADATTSTPYLAGDGLCDPSNPNRPQDIKDFVANCGVRYYGAAEMGQYFFMSFKVPDVGWDDEEWSAFYRIVSMETYNDQDVATAMQQIANDFPGDVEFTVTAPDWGWLAPEASGGTLAPEDWDAFEASYDDDESGRDRGGQTGHDGRGLLLPRERRGEPGVRGGARPSRQAAGQLGAAGAGRTRSWRQVLGKDHSHAVCRRDGPLPLPRPAELTREPCCDTES